MKSSYTGYFRNRDKTSCKSVNLHVKRRKNKIFQYDALFSRELSLESYYIGAILNETYSKSIFLKMKLRVKKNLFFIYFCAWNNYSVNYSFLRVILYFERHLINLIIFHMEKIYSFLSTYFLLWPVVWFREHPVYVYFSYTQLHEQNETLTARIERWNFSLENVSSDKPKYRKITGAANRCRKKLHGSLEVKKEICIWLTS